MMRDTERFERGLPSIARNGLTTGPMDRSTYAQHREAAYARPLSPTLAHPRDTSHYSVARPGSPTLQRKYTEEVRIVSKQVRFLAPFTKRRL